MGDARGSNRVKQDHQQRKLWPAVGASIWSRRTDSGFMETNATNAITHTSHKHTAHTILCGPCLFLVVSLHISNVEALHRAVQLLPCKRYRAQAMRTLGGSNCVNLGERARLTCTRPTFTCTAGWLCWQWDKPMGKTIGCISIIPILSGQEFNRSCLCRKTVDVVSQSN